MITNNKISYSNRDFGSIELSASIVNKSYLVNELDKINHYETIVRSSRHDGDVIGEWNIMRNVEKTRINKLAS